MVKFKFLLVLVIGAAALFSGCVAGPVTSYDSYGVARRPEAMSHRVEGQPSFDRGLTAAPASPLRENLPNYTPPPAPARPVFQRPPDYSVTGPSYRDAPRFEPVPRGNSVTGPSYRPR